ncbi:MAG TPA: hypothetical protein VFW11_19945 [Cyclobacteriaceae bacterium]|nr:hypothetical protein [Cyclobacteriaceae bacterium]
MNKILFFLAGTALGHVSCAQEYLSNEAEITTHAERVMKYIESSQFQNAFSLLKKYWPLPEN